MQSDVTATAVLLRGRSHGLRRRRAARLLLLRFHFLHGGFAREPDLARALIDAHAFYPDHLAHLHDVFSPTNAEVGELANVAEAFLARRALDKAAEVFDARDTTVVEFSDFNRRTATTTRASAAQAVNFRDSARHGVAIVGVDEHLAGVVLCDVDLRARCFSDASNRFAARPDEQANLFGIDLNRLYPGGELAEVRAGSGQGREHRLQDFDTSITRLQDRSPRDLERQAVNL